MKFFYGNNCEKRPNSYVACRLTKKCPHDCVYCISDEYTTDNVLDKPNIDKMVESIVITSPDVVIEGGEPLLMMDECLELVQKLRPKVDKIHIYSSMPPICSTKKDVLKQILNIVDGINFSMQHYDPIIADKLRNTVTPDYHNRNELLKELVDEFGNKIRVSFNLILGSLDTFEHLYNNIMFFINIGITNLRISELLLMPPLYVPITSIIKNKKLFKSPYAFGCKLDYDAHQLIDEIPIGKCKITIRRACFLVEPSEKATIYDLIKMFKLSKKKSDDFNFKIVLEDGTIHNNWNSELT